MVNNLFAYDSLFSMTTKSKYFSIAMDCFNLFCKVYVDIFNEHKDRLFDCWY